MAPYWEPMAGWRHFATLGFWRKTVSIQAARWMRPCKFWGRDCYKAITYAWDPGSTRNSPHIFYTWYYIYISYIISTNLLSSHLASPCKSAVWVDRNGLGTTAESPNTRSAMYCTARTQSQDEPTNPTIPLQQWKKRVWFWMVHLVGRRIGNKRSR